LGGLHPRILEIADLMTAAPFDYVIVETVGVGQSEIEIAGLADTTLVVLVPEAGDEVQTMKAGLMEIAQLFVVNKADRPDADQFVHNLQLMLAPAYRDHAHDAIPILKTVASKREGIAALAEAIEKHISEGVVNIRRSWLLAEKAYWLIQQHRMQDIDKQELKLKLEAMSEQVNLYRFIKQYV
jgi:LAO/AO transport system kinase